MIRRTRGRPLSAADTALRASFGKPRCIPYRYASINVQLTISHASLSLCNLRHHSRGTLIPLHSTLAGQMAAIAREYGLPSTGGIALYLVELNQEQHNPLSDALVGGPRIGDEAWQLLWGQLFAPLQDDCMEASLSEEDEPYFDQYAPARHDTSVPVMPPLPPSMRPSQPAYGPQESSSLHHTNDNRPASPSEHQSDVSSLVDNSSALASEDHLGQQSMVSSNASHIFSSGSLSTRQPKSSNTSFNQEHDSSMPSSPHGRPYSSASRGRPRNHPRSQFRTASSANLRSNASRHSIRSNRSYSQSNTSLDGPLYGEAVVVGKIEFDIDNRRGAGKWFDAWMQSANAQSSGASSPVEPVQTISKPTLSRPRPSHSSSGSLLYGRNRISELGLPDATQQESSESAPPHEVHPSEHVRSMGDEGKLSADNEVEPQPESNQGGSVRDSIASSMHSSQGPLPASAIQVASPQDTKPEYIFSLDNANPRLSADSAVLTGSKRSSQASQASLLSPSQVPISQRSSGDVASWQTDPSKSGDESHQFISERSSSSSFGHEANIEAMNATPRVRAAPAFQTRPMSCTPSSPSGSVISHERSVSELSTTSSTKESSHRMSAQSDVAANLPSLPSQSAFSDDGLPSRRHSNASSVYDDQHRASGISQVSNDEDQAELELDHHSESVRASQNSSRASSHSRHSSSSVDAVSIDQHQYQALADDEPETYITLSSSNSQSGHETELAMAAPFTTVIPETQGAAESQYGASEVEDTRSAVGEIESEVDITKGDPLRDMFPSDANTWAQIKYSHDPEDSATDSPAEELVQTALGLGISSSSMLNSHAIPPSASSSLDPFEYDDETGDALNSPVGPLEDDVKEVTDMLKANSAPVHFGLSSPINLGEPSKRLSRQSQASMPDKVVEANAVSISSDLTRSRAASRSSVARSMKSSLGSALSSPNSALSPVDPATIALPESNSNSSLSTLAPSASSKSLASAASQPSIWEPENTMTEAPKMTNRDARLPVDWADQLSAMGTLRSRGNSVTTDGDGDVSEETGLPMPVGELPQFMSQLGEATQSRASLASLYAQSARSRSSSVEMMDNLDEIERALAELSPRALKSTLGDDAVCDPCSKVCFHKLTCCLSQGAPNLTTFLQQAGALATMPGYAKDSIEEQLAPITPRAAPFDVASDDALATTSTESQASLRSEPRPSTDEDAHDQTIIASSQSFKSLESYNSGYMAPPLPLKIRTGRSEPGSPSPASDRSGPTPLATSVDLPQVGTPTTEAPMEESIISPGGQSRASTTIPYDAPSVHDSPQQRVTFAPDPQEASEQLSTPTAKSGMSSKFAAGLKLKSWSGKSSQKELSPSPSPQSKDSSNSGNHTKEPAKSPLPGLKGFKWWQKEGASLSEDSVQSECRKPSFKDTIC